MEAFRVASSKKKIVNQNQYHIPGGTGEISTTNQNLNDGVIMLPITSPYNSPVCQVKKTDGS